MNVLAPTTERSTIIARRACGCVAGAIVETDTPLGAVYKFVLALEKRGHTVERVTSASVRALPWRCTAHNGGPGI